MVNVFPIDREVSYKVRIAFGAYVFSFMLFEVFTRSKQLLRLEVPAY